MPVSHGQQQQPWDSPTIPFPAQQLLCPFLTHLDQLPFAREGMGVGSFRLARWPCRGDTAACPPPWGRDVPSPPTELLRRMSLSPFRSGEPLSLLQKRITKTSNYAFLSACLPSS